MKVVKKTQFSSFSTVYMIYFTLSAVTVNVSAWESSLKPCSAKGY